MMMSLSLVPSTIVTMNVRARNSLTAKETTDRQLHQAARTNAVYYSNLTDARKIQTFFHNYGPKQELEVYL